MKDLRIDIINQEPIVVFDLSGRLAGPAITKLTEACEPIEGKFVLDLSKLRFADDTGIDVIRMLREKGAEIRGASSFIKLLMDGDLGQKREES